MRTTILAAALAVTLLLPAATFAHAPLGGRFSVASTEGGTRAGAAQVTLTWDEAGSRISSSNVALARLHTLLGDGFQLSRQVPVRFALDEEAGTLVFSGTARNGRAEGQFTFEPSVSFADQIERRALDRPTDAQLLALTLQGTGLAEIDRFAQTLANRTARPSVVDLLASGVTEAYVEALAEVGYDDLTAGQIISLRSHGVTVGYIHRLQTLGYVRLSPDQVLQLDAGGVSPGFIQQANEGRRSLRSVDDLLWMRRNDS